MNSRFTIFVFFALVSIHSIGCSESGIVISANGPGSLYGVVRLYDSQGALFTDHSGVLVQCEGTTHKTYTDYTGYWEIPNIPVQSYSLNYSKDGFTSWKDSVRMIDEITEVRETTLYAIPSLTVSLDGIFLPHDFIDRTNAFVHQAGFIYGHTSSFSLSYSYVNVALAFSKTERIYIDDTATYSFLVFENFPITDTQRILNFASNISYTTFTRNPDHPFKPGEQVYCRAFPYLYLVTYYDGQKNKQAVSGFGKGSNVLSAVLP